ncbi:hypothetical protein DL96DRAFT_1593150 [Flagelloscypha sp. PMI_526]|nr:hypothetical protein DL96DRAFT_1593150 [Flagelloscypha sp. PMI_526]
MGRRRRTCPLCGSKKWHKEPLSGAIACEEGHVLQNYRNEAEDAGDDFTQNFHKKRHIKSRREKKDRSRANKELYHGMKARRLYFQCLQIVLRHQIQDLTKLWHLPPEFESVCRELWALYLSVLPEPVPDMSAVVLRCRSPEYAEVPSPSTSKTRPLEEKRPSLFADGSDSEGSFVLDPDPELDDLLRQHEELSLSSDEASGGESVRLLVLVMGCWMLRIPILYRDLLSLVESYKLSYLSALNCIPKDLRQTSEQVVNPGSHTSSTVLCAYLSEVLSLTSFQHTPRTLSLHSLVSLTCKKLNSSFAIHVPEMNAAPVLWRITKYMAGTPALYCLTKRVAETLSLPLTLPSNSGARALTIGEKGKATHFENDSVVPEITLFASIIIVLKLVYGLDGKVPERNDDPACFLPSTKFDRLRQENEEDRFSSKVEMNMSTMSNDDLDEYLAFCRRALVGNDQG